MRRARVRFDARDYRAALAEATAALTHDPANAEAAQIKADAEARLAALERLLDQATRAIAANDAVGAAGLLAQAQELAPGDARVAEVVGAAARPRAGATGRGPARAASVSAARRRRQEPPAAPPARTGPARGSSRPPPAPPPPPGPPPARAPPVAAAPPAAVPPPPMPPPPVVQRPSRGRTPPSRRRRAGAGAAARPPPAAAPVRESDDAAIRRAIATYERAIESKDLALFRSVRPGLSADEERRLRASFDQVTQPADRHPDRDHHGDRRHGHGAARPAGHSGDGWTVADHASRRRRCGWHGETPAGSSSSWGADPRATRGGLSDREAAVCLAVICVALVAAPARAQDPPHNEAVRVEQLWRIFNDLYGPEGLVVDSTASLAGGQSHSGHFIGGFESEFSQFGVALTSQLVSLPQPTPAAGFTYQFDPALGVFNRTTNNFGPIMSERAETIGARRLSTGFATQRLEFDLIEGLDLSHIPAVFSHDNAELLGGREDVITTVNSVEASFTRSTLFLTYGVTNRFDVSVAIPWVTADMTVTSDATIRRIGTRIPEIHFFRSLEDTIGDRRIFTAFGNASGIGDINLRAKATLTPHRAPGVRPRHRLAPAQRRRARPARHRRARRAALCGVVGLVRAVLAACERGVSMERLERARRRAGIGRVARPARRGALQRRRRRSSCTRGSRSRPTCSGAGSSTRRGCRARPSMRSTACTTFPDIAFRKDSLTS